MAEVEDEVDYNDPNQPTVTEELLQIFEEFAEYIDKFMFEIVTFLAVIDSSMGLFKDVLSMFGFSGWKMTFFPTFSFIVTIGVFLFGTNKRKGKRKAEAAELEGLGQAMEMFDDILEVVDDVVEEVEKVECEAGGLGLGDYSDSDEDGDDEGNAEKTEIKEGETTDVVVEIEVVPGEEAQEPQQQDAEPEPPPKSSIAKAIGTAIMVAGIVAKLAGKRKSEEPQQDENTTQNETNNELSNISSDNSKNNCGGSTTGDQVPPTDPKSKLQTDTCQTDTLAEIAEDLKQESIEIATTVKNEAIKATDIVIEGSKEAGVIVHDNTKAALESTGALKAGHGLYREIDFISGHLKKEGLKTGKVLEKETLGVAKQVQGNRIVKDTGADKLGQGVYREAAFITSHVDKRTKDVLQQEEQILVGLLGGNASTQSHSTSASSLPKGSVCRDHNTLAKNKGTRQFTQPRQNNQTPIKTNTAIVTDNSQQRRQVAGATEQLARNHPRTCTRQNIGLAGNTNDNIRQKGTSEVGHSQEGSRNNAAKLTAQNQPRNKQRPATSTEESNFTKHALSSTGTLNLGHGLYKEAEFIAGYTKREGIETGRKIEKETTEAVNALRENKLVRESGLENLGTSVYREAEFIAVHTKKEGIATGRKIEKETSQAVNALRENQLIKESGLDNLGAGVYREAAFVGGLFCNETSKANRSGQQDISQLNQPGPSGVKLESIKTEGTIKDRKAAVPKDVKTNDNTKHEIIEAVEILSESDNTCGKQQDIAPSSVQQEADTNNEKAEGLEQSEPRTDVSNMAANVVEGVAGAAGSVTNEAMNIDKKAQQGVQQAAKKSKGLLPIIMRLVRLIMRVAKKGKGSSSAGSSRRASVASTVDTKDSEPSQEKRSASDGGSAGGAAAAAAGAAASLAMGAAAGGGAGGKGGKIGAIVGIVVRLVRLASKLKGGGKGPSTPTTRRNSSESIEQQSDDEFFDCGEDFPTAEMETQTEDMYLLPVQTQAAIKDLRTKTGTDNFDVANEQDAVLTEESLSEELKSIALELQEVACDNATSSLSGLASRLRALGSDRTPLLDDTEQIIVEDNPSFTNSKPEKHLSETPSVTSQPPQFSVTSPNQSNVITLKILSSSLQGTGSEIGSPRTILIDLGTSEATVHTADIAQSQTCNNNSDDSQTIAPNGRQNNTHVDRQSYDRQISASNGGQNVTSAQIRRSSLPRGDRSSWSEKELKELENQIQSWSQQSIPQNDIYGTSSEGSGIKDGCQQQHLESQLPRCISSQASTSSLRSSRDVLVDVHTPRAGSQLEEMSYRNRSSCGTYNEELLSPGRDPLSQGYSRIENRLDKYSRTFSSENDQRTLDRQSSCPTGGGTVGGYPFVGSSGTDDRARKHSGHRTIDRRSSYSSDDVNLTANGRYKTSNSFESDQRTVDRQSSYTRDEVYLSDNGLNQHPRNDSRLFSSFDKRTVDRQSSYSVDSTNSTTNLLVAYDSSCEDLIQDNSFNYRRRRPSVVRFEDECTSSISMNNSTASIDLQREQPLKPALKQSTTIEQERQPYSQSADDNRKHRPHAERASGSSQHTTRLYSVDPDPRALIGYQSRDSNTERTDYLYNDEFENQNSLC